MRDFRELQEWDDRHAVAAFIAAMVAWGIVGLGVLSALFMLGMI